MEKEVLITLHKKDQEDDYKVVEFIFYTDGTYDIGGGIRGSFWKVIGGNLHFNHRQCSADSQGWSPFRSMCREWGELLEAELAIRAIINE